MNLVPKEDAKVGAGYGDVLQKDGPVEFLNGTGVVCQNNNDYDIFMRQCVMLLVRSLVATL